MIILPVMRTFLLDFLKFPFESQNPHNKFAQFLTLMLKDYPAFLWTKPTLKKILLLPLLIIYAIFKKKEGP